MVIRIGVPPRRIEFLTSISGLVFEEAWSERVATQIAGIDVFVPSRRHLIVNKRAAGRPKDLVDADWLEQTKNWDSENND